jgi:type IV pilus assembly protein PilB
VIVYEPTPEERELYDHFGGTDKEKFVHGVGCNYCSHTGYRERVGVYEVLAVTDEIRQLIVSSAPPAVIRELAVSQVMRTMSHEAMALVAADITTIDEVIHNVYVN